MTMIDRLSMGVECIYRFALLLAGLGWARWTAFDRRLHGAALRDSFENRLARSLIVVKLACAYQLPAFAGHLLPSGGQVGNEFIVVPGIGRELTRQHHQPAHRNDLPG